MAASADVDSVSGWSKASEPRLPKPKLPGRYVHQSSVDYPGAFHFGSADEDADSPIEVTTKFYNKMETAQSKKSKRHWASITCLLRRHSHGAELPLRKGKEERDERKFPISKRQGSNWRRKRGQSSTRSTEEKRA
eukprot:6376576-Amphidinium_carterae.1